MADQLWLMKRIQEEEVMMQHLHLILCLALYCKCVCNFSEFCLCLFVEYHSMLIECLMSLKKNIAKVRAVKIACIVTGIH